MKTCSCGHVMEDGEKFCTACGRKYETAVNEPLDAAPISSAFVPVKPAEKKEPAKPKKTDDNISDAAPISSIFERKNDESKSAEKKKPHVRPEVPKPSDKVEVKPLANATGGVKLNPLKNPPPLESPYSVLNPTITAIHVFFMMLPVVGVIYSFILALCAKKHNTKMLGIAFLLVFLCIVVLFALAFLIMSKFFEPLFNEICGIIKYMFDTFLALIK